MPLLWIRAKKNNTLVLLLRCPIFVLYLQGFSLTASPNHLLAMSLCSPVTTLVQRRGVPPSFPFWEGLASQVRGVQETATVVCSFRVRLSLKDLNELRPFLGLPCVMTSKAVV